MIEISKCMAQGGGLAKAFLKRSASVALDWDTRQKSRFDFHGPDGAHYGVFLPRGTVVRGGDVLVAANGDLLVVQAAPQAVIKIQADPLHGSPFDLLRAAYHLGNRHVPIELKPDHLKIEPDHVLADMVRAMGLQVMAVDEGFEPESGAYAQGGHGHGGHDHGHSGHAHGHDDHDHGHDHRDHDHTPNAASAVQAQGAHGTEPGHVHGPHCKHGHGHDHG